MGSRVGFRSPNIDNARINTVCEDTCAKRLLELFDFLIIDFFTCNKKIRSCESFL